MRSVDPKNLPQAWRIPDVLAGSLAANLLALALPITMLQVYDRVLHHHALSTFSFLIIALAGTAVAEFALRTSRDWLLLGHRTRWQHRAFSQGFHKLLQADLEETEKQAPSEVLTRFQSLVRLYDDSLGPSGTVYVDALFVILFLVILTVMAGALALVPVVFIALLALGIYLTGSQLKAALRKHNENESRRYRFVAQVLESISTVKAMALEALMLRRYERLQESSAENICRITALTTLTQGFASLCSNLAVISVVSIGSLMVLDQTMSLGTLAASSLLTSRILQPVARISGTWVNRQDFNLAEEQANALWSLRDEVKPHHRSAPQLEGSLTIEDLSFQYEDGEAPVINGLNLHVRPGQMIGITGDSGTGTSTLMRLLSLQLTPSGGEIAFDGHVASEFYPSSLRRQVGIVPQEATLIEGSILDNITMGRTDTLSADAIEALALLETDDFIMRLPNGLNTKVGGIVSEAIPPGIRQRIALARVLALDPPILLFDSGNSGMDANSDKQVTAFLEDQKGRRTMIIVSRRPSLLAICDRCFELNDGKLAEFIPAISKKKNKASPPAPPMERLEAALEELKLSQAGEA